MPPAVDYHSSIEALARAVLYEGYLLYPYRLSAMKNRQRWSFGALFPSNYCQGRDDAERSVMQTECFIEGNDTTLLQARFRFLQLVGEETIERDIEFPATAIAEICCRRCEFRFSFSPVEASVFACAERIAPGIYKVCLRLVNESTFAVLDRDEALRYSLISAQKLLRVRSGSFFSAMEPPQQAGEMNRCQNIGAWPALVGDPAARDTILSAPIILEDFPGVAPESRTDFFDSTEIDELLSLRLMTLSEAEKDEMGKAEHHVRQLLERAERLDTDGLLSLHGAFRDMAISHISPTSDRSSIEKPGEMLSADRSESSAGASNAVQKGARVRLRPRARADILDLALAGKSATVTSIEHDFENRTYVCVVLDDDPGRDLGQLGHPGHRFFFALDEVEPL